MKNSQNKKELIYLTMQLDLKAKEYELLCKEFADLKAKNLDKNAKEFVDLREKFLKNNQDIKEINNQLRLLKN